MSIITEIKRILVKDEFAALIMPNNIESLEHVGGLYLKITTLQFERLQKIAALVPGTKNELGASDLCFVAKAVDFFNRITLLDTAVKDTDDLMRLVDQSNLKAIPPVEENVLSVLAENTQIDWKIEIRNDDGIFSLIIYGDGVDANGASFQLDSDQYPLDRFNPDLMKKEFFAI